MILYHYGTTTPGVPVDTSGYQWIPADTSAVDTSGYQWIPVGTSWYQWVPVGNNWYQWVPFGTNGYQEYREDQDQISGATYISGVVFFNLI